MEPRGRSGEEWDVQERDGVKEERREGRKRDVGLALGGCGWKERESQSRAKKGGCGTYCTAHSSSNVERASEMSSSRKKKLFSSSSSLQSLFLPKSGSFLPPASLPPASFLCFVISMFDV